MVITPIVNDGRINRSKTTLNKIVAATISLLRKNNNGQIPTAQEIAVKSGVGIRTVFRHIDDMEGLIEEVNRRYLHDLESYIAKNNPKQNSKGLRTKRTNYNADLQSDERIDRKQTEPNNNAREQNRLTE